MILLVRKIIGMAVWHLFPRLAHAQTLSSLESSLCSSSCRRVVAVVLIVVVAATTTATATATAMIARWWWKWSWSWWTRRRINYKRSRIKESCINARLSRVVCSHDSNRGGGITRIDSPFVFLGCELLWPITDSVTSGERKRERRRK